MALTDKLSAIGEAIRAKTGKSDKLTLDQMPGEIAGITSGGSGDVTLLEGLSFELDFSNGDMPFAAPNGYAVKSAIVKKPATLIPANIKSGVEVAGITGTLSGGGSSADVRYVTFMNGDTVLYKKPVAVGDDCVDVVVKGLVSTPTKESTAQYNFTYYGWGATDNGAADANILKNITEDKTVYAIYTATVRTYTITYYDSDGTTVLTTQPVAYGTVPSYEPTKSGYVFAGYTTELVEVTGDASYTATWSEKLTFAGATWGDIARISEAGDAQKHFALGDTRVISVNGVDCTFQIVGFNHDDLADGSGKAGITCMMKGCVTGDKVAWASSSTNVLYSKSIVDSTVCGYLSTLESNLQSVIKSVNKKVDGKIYVAFDDGTITTVSRKLWIPCIQELNYSNAAWYTKTLGTRYEWYSSYRTADYPTISAASRVWMRNLSLHSTMSCQNTYMDTGYGKMENYQCCESTYDIFFGFCI